MLTGVRGIGKTTTARLIARALNYSLSDRPTVHMDEMGEHCEAILESRHVDVIEMDAASHTSVDNIREIIEQVPYKPISARYKVYIIDEVHMLSRAAFNALLKTLEEPPEHVKFIFATTEIRKVPVTVLSRCQRFDLRRVESAPLMRHLARICELEQVGHEEEALRLIARAAEGSVRDALSLLDQAIAYGQDTVRTEDVSSMLGLMDRTRIIDLFEAVMGGRLEEALAALAEQHALGAEPLTVLNDLAAFTHLVTRMRILGESGADAAHSEEERRRGLELAGKLSMPALTRAWQMLLKGIAEVQAASRPLPAAEMVLIRLAHAADMPSPADLVKRLSQAPAGNAGGGAGSAAGARSATPSPSASGGPAGATMQNPAPSSGHTSAGTFPPDGAHAATAERLPAPRSFEEIVELAGQMRDLRLKTALERQVRPVRVSEGRLEIALEADAPRDLANEIARKLGMWTGRRWAVILSDEPGEETLHARRLRMRESLFAKAEERPEVQEILRRFPDARVVDVRPPEPAEMNPIQEEE